MTNAGVTELLFPAAVGICGGDTIAIAEL